jgi:hypothetical protein
MTKFSASIQLSPFPGHCSQKLFFLFPIPSSLFFINLIFFNLFSSRLCMNLEISNKITYLDLSYLSRRIFTYGHEAWLTGSYIEVWLKITITFSIHVVLTKNKRLFRFDSCLTLQNSFFFSFDIAFLLYRFRFFSLYFLFLLYRFRRFFSLDFVFLLYRFRT